jgi:AbrB family looped-hinge helix DNA binding protein
MITVAITPMAVPMRDVRLMAGRNRIKPRGFWQPGGEGYGIVLAYVKKTMSRGDAIAALRAAGCTETLGRTDDESIGRHLLDWYARRVHNDLRPAPSQEPAQPEAPAGPHAPDRVVVGQGGRIVIPSPYREALGVQEGDELRVRFEDGELRLTTPRHALRRAQQSLRRHVPAGRSLADEIVAERRVEAERE